VNATSTTRLVNNPALAWSHGLGGRVGGAGHSRRPVWCCRSCRRTPILLDPITGPGHDGDFTGMLIKDASCTGVVGVINLASPMSVGSGLG
jgi:hypothetical protein